MNTAQPIRNEGDLRQFKEYYRIICPNKRNHLLMVMGLNTALRISDILDLRWGDVYDFELQRCRVHLQITEHKTGKGSVIWINSNIKKTLMEYKEYLEKEGRGSRKEQYLFASNRQTDQPISRVQAFRIVKKAAADCHLEGVISCHSLRKTFGYHAWRQGIEPALLMNIYNHSSFQITVRYLGIEQDDRDDIFRNINI
jgi:integrase